MDNNRFTVGDRVYIAAPDSGFGRRVTGTITQGPRMSHYRTLEYGVQIDAGKNQPPTMTTAFVNESMLRRDIAEESPYGHF